MSSQDNNSPSQNNNITINTEPPQNNNITINTETPQNNNITINTEPPQNNLTDHVVNIVVNNTPIGNDISGNLLYNVDTSGNIIVIPKIDGSGYVITNSQGPDASGNFETHTTFNTTDPTQPVNIIENLSEKIVYSTSPDTDPVSKQLLANITQYAAKIKCSDFHGKGSVDDYQALFTAAANIANESKQMELDIDIDGFNEFGTAADQLSNLFTTFTTKLQNVNIINDDTFLTAVLSALEKIYNLSVVFGEFKETIIATSTVTVPKSVVDTRNILDSVTREVNCAMNYISNFVNPDPTLPDAQLSANELNVISKAVTTIDNWNILCEHGVSIALNSSPDIQNIKLTNKTFKTKAATLNNLTSTLQTKLNLMTTITK
jgi:hypothetical protein